MGRDHNPVPGKWYESLDDEEVFQVLSVDEDAELIELQYEDGDVEEIDYETWQELDLDLTVEPEGWSGSDDDEDDDDDRPRNVLSHQHRVVCLLEARLSDNVTALEHGVGFDLRVGGLTDVAK